MKKVFSIVIALITCQTLFAQALQLKGLVMSIGGLSNTVAFKISYNFNFGRKLQSVEKRLNNEDKDSGVLNGGK